MNKSLTYLCLSVITGILPLTHAQADSERTMLVIDASGSMWGQLEGKTKIEIAREAMATLVKDWPEGREAGLVAYGHRNKGDCSDIETLVPVGPLDAAQMTQTVNRLNPKGKTPLSAAVKQAAEALKFTEEKATVILLSDGKETCKMDPCALGTELEKLGVDFTAHVIGFDVKKTEDQAGLRCLAENTGGQFIPAGNAQELNAALEQTAKAPESAPEPPVPQAELIAPASVTKGTVISVELKAEDDNIGGYIQLYPNGKDKHIAYGYVKPGAISGYEPTKFRLPAIPGEFTLKWVTKKQRVIAETPLTITDAEISITAAESANKGTVIEVTMDAPEGLDGYIQLYPKGKDKHVAYGYVRADSTSGYKPTTFRLPATPGDYTLKWVTSQRRVLAETPLTITEAEITISTVESAPKGTTVDVVLDAPDGLDGYIQLFPKDKQKHVAYGYVKADNIEGYKPTTIRLPALTGDFTLKWVSKKNELLAETPLIISDIEASLKAPDTAIQATLLEIELDAPEGLDGYIQLFPKGKQKHVTYGYVREGDINGYKPTKLRLPARPGDYTLKWATKNQEILTEAPLTITAADLSLEAPEQAEKDTKLPVRPVGPDGLSGYISLYAKGKNKQIAYGYVRPANDQGYKPATVKLPKVNGEFVLKWETKAREVLAEQPIRIVDEITE
ncbi:MAG: vWA domain-containing protein [Thiolinea sp.]